MSSLICFSSDSGNVGECLLGTRAKGSVQKNGLSLGSLVLERQVGKILSSGGKNETQVICMRLQNLL